MWYFLKISLFFSSQRTFSFECERIFLIYSSEIVTFYVKIEVKIVVWKKSNKILTIKVIFLKIILRSLMNA